jgi:hypothetical protein
MEEKFKAYAGGSVPKAVRDQIFFRRSTPRVIPARPFMRAAMAQVQQAGDAAERVFNKAMFSSFQPVNRVEVEA